MTIFVFVHKTSDLAFVGLDLTFNGVELFPCLSIKFDIQRLLDAILI